MLLLCLGTGLGLRIATASVRTGFAMKRGLAWGAVGRATARVAPTGENAPPLKCLAEFAARRRQNYACGRLGAFWQKNRRFFARDDKRAVPEWDSPFESVKRVYCAALAALMDSISSGTTLNRSPTIP